MTTAPATSTVAPAASPTNSAVLLCGRSARAPAPTMSSRARVLTAMGIFLHTVRGGCHKNRGCPFTESPKGAGNSGAAQARVNCGTSTDVTESSQSMRLMYSGTLVRINASRRHRRQFISLIVHHHCMHSNVYTQHVYNCCKRPCWRRHSCAHHQIIHPLNMKAAISDGGVGGGW